MLGLPTSAAMVELIQRADENRCARKQHHCQRKLADDQKLAEALMAATACHPTPAIFQRFVDVESQGKERRCHPENDRGNQ